MDESIAIDARNLGKKYLIGHQKSPELRKSIVSNVKNRIRGRREEIEEFWALSDLNFNIKKGETIGIVGKNGAGKSTLLKILSQITEPSTGRVEIDGRVSSLLEVGTGFHPELSGRENIFLNGTILGMRRTEIKSKFSEIVEFSGVEKFIDTPVKHYSSGMKVRLAFSVAAHLEPEILIVDEVLAVGDVEFQKKCLGKMDEVSKSYGRTVLFVSHNLQAVQRLCASGLLLERGAISVQGDIGNVINTYNRTRTVEGTVFPNDEVVQEVSASVCSGKLEISVAIRNFESNKSPFLGFTVTDENSNTIFGTNPKLSSFDLNKKIKAGRVRAEITSPILRNGTYYISVWLGDGSEDIFTLNEGLAIEVEGMADSKYHPEAMRVGRVVPNVKWVIED